MRRGFALAVCFSISASFASIHLFVGWISYPIGFKCYYTSELLFQSMPHTNGLLERHNKAALCGTESTHAITESTESALSFPLHNLFVQTLYTQP